MTRPNTTPRREQAPIPAPDVNGTIKRQPLFAFWLIPVSAAIVEGLALLALWPATAVHGWSASVVFVSAITVALAAYVAGELLRWRFRVSLKVLMALVALVCVISGTLGVRLHHARVQHQRATAIKVAGGHAWYDIDEGFGRSFKTKTGWMWPKWMLDFFGQGFFGEIKRATFTDVGALDPDLNRLDVGVLREIPEIAFLHIPITDKGLSRLEGHDQIRSLGLYSAKITDDGLIHLRNMRRLESLWLTSTLISDAGLRHLREHRQLRFLSLRGTGVSDAAVAELHQTLPDCRISR